MDKVPMTVQGHKALTAEFEHRTSNERRRIIDAIRPQAGESMVEIGPGLGAMTAPLIERLGLRR